MKRSKRWLWLGLGLAFAISGWTETQPVALKAAVPAQFQFIVYGDTRFTNPADTEAANPAVRVALVKAIAEAHPAFLCFGGDIVYNGNDANDWKVYDAETQVWREKGLRVFPALGNHDLHGAPEVALGNYFARYPELEKNRYYSVRAGNVLLLVLDSALNETDGEQGKWLRAELDGLPKDVEFVAILMHHPPYTSSSDEKKFGGGHSARGTEQALAKFLEERQGKMKARIVVFSGHVHNYERHEHGGVVYFVTGGGGAHAYPIERASDDLFKSDTVNYHYLTVEVSAGTMKVTMHRLALEGGAEKWTEPDRVTLGR